MQEAIEEWAVTSELGEKTESQPWLYLLCAGRVRRAVGQVAHCTIPRAAVML